MGIAENKRVVQEFYEAANRGDTQAVMSKLADDVRWTNIGSTKYSGVCEGKNELTTKILVPVFSQFKEGICSIIHNLIAEGDIVVVQSSGKAETKDGRPYNNTYCHIFTIREGKITEVMEYMDTELVTATFGK
jgi:uncharacterized protein